MSNRRGGRDEEQEMGSSSGESLDAQLAQLGKSNAKMERMLGKIGTHADNAEFRDHLATERADAAKLAKSIVARIRAEGAAARKPLLRQFEREYTRFSALVDKIDLKQKQQLVAFSHTHSNAAGLALAAAEESGPHAGSFRQDQLPAEADIAFLELQVDEVAQRHLQLQAVERDVREVAEIFKDLKHMVDEQQVQIDVIDANISSSKAHAEEGLRELTSAEAHQRAARKRACCVLFIVLAIIIIIVVVVLALKGKF
jgi:syntaxin 7